MQNATQTHGNYTILVRYHELLAQEMYRLPCLLRSDLLLGLTPTYHEAASFGEDSAQTLLRFENVAKWEVEDYTGRISEYLSSPGMNPQATPYRIWLDSRLVADFPVSADWKPPFALRMKYPVSLLDDEEIQEILRRVCEPVPPDHLLESSDDAAYEVAWFEAPTREVATAKANAVSGRMFRKIGANHQIDCYAPAETEPFAVYPRDLKRAES